MRIKWITDLIMIDVIMTWGIKIIQFIFLGQVLFTMWQHQELRDVYKKHGWKEQDFVTKTVAARNSGPNSPNNANR